MLAQLLRNFDKIFPPQIALAHCDVPCGIYKAEPSQTAAETVVKMVEKILALPKENPTAGDRNTFVRCVLVKEQHAELCKKEVLILWTDFFKSEHLQKWPNLHEMVWEAAKLCSENKREVSLEKAKELLAKVEAIGGMLGEAQAAAKK